MADSSDYPEPLTSRTLIHGRNVMAISATILAVAALSSIGGDFDVTTVEVFGLNPGKHIWAILALALIYYTWRFYLDSQVDYQRWVEAWDVYLKHNVPTDGRNPARTPSLNADQWRRIADHDHAHRLLRRYQRWDFGLPIVMAAAALITAIYKMITLL